MKINDILLVVVSLLVGGTFCSLIAYESDPVAAATEQVMTAQKQALEKKCGNSGEDVAKAVAAQKEADRRYYENLINTQYDKKTRDY